MMAYMKSLPEDQRPSGPPQRNQNVQSAGGEQQGRMGPPPEEEMDEARQMVWVKNDGIMK
ncbi:MAG: hypothetical protein GY852_01545 [bacterium]|nr:hypothetical protein [bacterium]